MSLLPIFPDRELSIIAGSGATLIDEQGGRYLDAIANYGVNILGYSHPRLLETLRAESAHLINLHGSFRSPLREKYANRLTSKVSKHLNWDYPSVYLCSTGAEAVESGIKFARQATGRQNIVSCAMGYHGKTLGALSATRTQQKYRTPFEPLVPGFSGIPFNDLAALEKAITTETAAFLVEIVQGEGGIRCAQADFLKQAQHLCRERGCLLFVDEIQSGMGRTGYFLACEHHGIAPDVLTLSKGIAGGYPFAAVIMAEPACRNLERGLHTSTFGGAPLACALANTVLDILEEPETLPRVRQLSERIFGGLRAIQAPVIREVRGYGLMIGIECRERVSKYMKVMQDKGVLVGAATANVLRLLPPFVLTDPEADLLVSTVSEVLGHG